LNYTPSGTIVFRGPRQIDAREVGIGTWTYSATGHATGQATPSSRASRARHVGFDPTVSEALINKPASELSLWVVIHVKKEETEREERSPWSSSSPPGGFGPPEKQEEREGRERNPSKKKRKRQVLRKHVPCVGPLRIAVVGLSRRRRCGDKARVKRPTRTQTYLCT